MEKKVKLQVPELVSKNVIRHHGEDIEIKEFISFEEMLEMVNNCVEGSFDISGEYLPELTDFYIRRETIDIYTNIELGFNPAEVYALLYQTDIFDVVINEINIKQFEEVKKSIERKIIHLLRTNEKAHNKEFDDISSLFQTLGERFESAFGDLKLDGLADAFNKITDDNFIKYLTNSTTNVEHVTTDEH